MNIDREKFFSEGSMNIDFLYNLIVEIIGGSNSDTLAGQLVQNLSATLGQQLQDAATIYEIISMMQNLNISVETMTITMTTLNYAGKK